MDLIADKRGTLEIKNSNLHDVNMELVNEFSQVPLKRDEVYIRSMYLCNDMIDAYASRFTVEALEEITRLVVGESVLKGHQHSSLPIARFFKAEVVEKDDHNWVRAWFYWLKDTEGALDLARNIDGGVYREVSISWRYKTAACNICHEDIRKCPHIPGDYYSGELCFYEMSEIQEVLEGSLVFKGGQIGTSIAGERSAKKDISSSKRKQKEEQRKIRELEKENRGLRKFAELGKRRVKEIKEEILRLARVVSHVEEDSDRFIRIQEKMTAAEIDCDLLMDYWKDFKRDFDRLFPPRRISMVEELSGNAQKSENVDSYRIGG